MRYRIRVFFRDERKQPVDRFVEDAPGPNEAFVLAVPEIGDVSFAEVYEAGIDVGAAPVTSRMSIEAVDVLDRFICECGGSKYYLREDQDGRKTIVVKGKQPDAFGRTEVPWALEAVADDLWQFPNKVREEALRALGRRCYVF